MKSKDIIQILKTFNIHDLFRGDIDVKMLEEKTCEFKYIKKNERSVFCIDLIETIIYFIDFDIYISIDGIFSSWEDDVYFTEDYMFESEPKIVTNIIYEKRKK